jgi:hypothetical protein
MTRRALLLCAGVVLTLLPTAARAEVSVIVDGRGHVKRVVYLTRNSDKSTVIWKQVRARVPFETMLNPLGDTTGDLAPSIAVNPLSGQPWVVWPRNEGNQKRLVLSMWNGRGWTDPQPIATPDIMGWDQVAPRLVFDQAGTPYLVFEEAARNGRILFVTRARGVWTPPLVLSEKGVDSRGPGAVLSDAALRVTWSTPTGVETRLLPTANLIEAATNLMDSPIPPGSASSPDDPKNPGGSDEPTEKPVLPH